MKTIKIWADIHSTGVFDEKGEYYIQKETSSSDETWKELQEWVEDYDDIAILSENERSLKRREIDELDKRGMSPPSAPCHMRDKSSLLF